LLLLAAAAEEDLHFLLGAAQVAAARVDLELIQIYLLLRGLQ